MNRKTESTRVTRLNRLQGLTAFVEIADTGTLAAAARRLGISAAAVSKNLARLEAQLGVRLFQRNTRRLRLTVEGEGFVERARTALQVLDDAVADVTRAQTAVSGRVRIGVGTAFGRRWLLPALPSIAREYPGLQIDVELDDRPLDLIEEGYDIGIRGGAPAHVSLVGRQLCRLPVVLVASPAYLASAGVPRQVSDLETHRCIQRRFANGSHSRWSFRSAATGDIRVLEPAAALVVNESDAVIDLAIAGAGIAQVGLYNSLEHLRAGRLLRLLPDEHDPGEREFQLHYSHRNYLAPRVRVVVDALLAHVRAVPDLHLTVDELPGEWTA